ncbi:MAG: SDR family NAD(P)-dependent oxidoreductase [Acidobacteria bacterium]|nr:SDR family NAD(P)-dependent oxidoreductase [Acidobacteriota bacterium]
MSKRTIVITGASDGIGAAAARALVHEGNTLVVVGRSPQKTETVAREIGADSFVVDYAHLRQVRELADSLLLKYPQIDVLANNAGGIIGDRRLTIDGNETTFQINHLAPFLLTRLLQDRLIESKATVINTASVANRYFAKFDIADLQLERGYSANRAYGNGKLANILFTKELNRRHGEDGISTAAFHPGGVATNFSVESNSMMRIAYTTVLRRVLLTPEQGATTMLWLINGQPGVDWEKGQYYAKNKISKANPQASDATLAQQLWDRSEDLVSDFLN